MRSFVVGGAGFIGSHLTARLIAEGPVTVYDNLSSGRRDSIERHLAAGTATLIEADALNQAALTKAMAGHDAVFHLVANPEPRLGLDRPRLDFEQSTVVTHNVLEAMRVTGISNLVFTSSSSVYGDTPEPRGELDLGHLPISLHAASKLAAESLISAYAECFGTRAWIFRLGSVVGPRAIHGPVLDFLNKLRSTKGAYLEVLGDGRQSKPYLYVTDCVAGMVFGFRHASSSTNPFTPSGTLREVTQLARAEGEQKSRVYVFNLAPSDSVTVRRIAELCVAASPFPQAEIRYKGGDRDWPGDVPHSRLKPDKLATLGFRVSHTSEEAIEMAAGALRGQVFG